MPDDIIEPLLELLRAVFRLNNTRLPIMASYAGHVNRLRITCFPGGWEMGKTGVEVFDDYLDGSLSPQQLIQARHDILRLSGCHGDEVTALPRDVAKPVIRKLYNLSDAERQRRRHRMKDYWAAKRNAQLTATP